MREISDFSNHLLRLHVNLTKQLKAPPDNSQEWRRHSLSMQRGCHAPSVFRACRMLKVRGLSSTNQSVPGRLMFNG